MLFLGELREEDANTADIWNTNVYNKEKRLKIHIKMLIAIMGMSSIMFLHGYIGNIKNQNRFHALMKIFPWLASPW